MAVAAPTADVATSDTSPDNSTRPNNAHSYGSFPSYERDGDESTRPKSPAAAPDPRDGTARTGSGGRQSAAASARDLKADLLRGFLMLAMALDHNALALNTWQHGTGREAEGDSVVVEEWNRTVAYVVRTITHLCAPGFTFLLGMGVVYLGRSRSRLGWTSWRLTKYFAVRAVVLTLVTVALGLVVTEGRIWFMNMVLFSLAVDYFLAGLLWLLMSKTEARLARLIENYTSKKAVEDVAEEPLLPPSASENVESTSATALSWHIHNALLFVLSVITIWWNVWLSSTHGHCTIQDHGSEDLSAWTAPPPQPPSMGPNASLNPFLGIWFWPVVTSTVMSGFPPLAWLSFSILGILYGRIITSRPSWSQNVSAIGHALAGLLFFIFFVLTRVFHFGNLSEGCTPTPETNPDGNPYLASPQAFFYIVKYPPDVAFWAFTMAGNLFLLAFFACIPVNIGKRLTLLLDFGKAALFFYVIHLFVVFIVGAILVSLLGHETDIPSSNPAVTKGITNIFGYFSAWALSMLLCWPVTRAYGRFKATKPADSIWRFF